MVAIHRPNRLFENFDLDELLMTKSVELPRNSPQVSPKAIKSPKRFMSQSAMNRLTSIKMVLDKKKDL